MRNLLENIAVFLVVLLALSIVALIVKYNMIEDDNLEDVIYTMPVVKKESKKEKVNNYLKEMENYADVDVKVNPTKEDTTNRIMVKSEQKEGSIDSAVKDTYVEKLENYAEDENKQVEVEKSDNIQNELEPTPPEKKEIVDKIGMALDDIIN
jgi:preprotein translocase subunit SecF